MVDILGGNLATKIAQHCETNELIQEEVKTDFHVDFSASQWNNERFHVIHWKFHVCVKLTIL